MSWSNNHIHFVEQACDFVGHALQQQSKSRSDDDTTSTTIIPAFTTITPCGSFPLRTSIPLRNGRHCADISFEIPEEVCNTEDVEQGRYLVIREQMIQVALERLENFNKNNKSYVQKQQRVQENDDDDQEDDDDEDNADSKQRKMKTLTISSLELVPISSFSIPEQFTSTSSAATGNITIRDKEHVIFKQKHFIRVIVSKKKHNKKGTSSSSTSSGGGEENLLLPSVVVNIFARPRHAGFINSAAKGPKRHPIYCPLVVEDLVLVRLMKQQVDIISRCPNYAVAAQLLRRWALLSGLVVPSSGEDSSLGNVNGNSIASVLAGNLNLFTVVSAPMLVLWNENTIAANSNIDGIVRAVWIFWTKYQIYNSSSLSSNTKNAAAATSTTTASSLPSLIIQTEPNLNILHRAIISTGGIDSIVAVADAAQSALTHGSSLETMLSSSSGLTQSLYERFDAVIRMDISFFKNKEKNDDAMVNVSLLQQKIKKALISRVSTVVVGSSSSNSNSNDDDIKKKKKTVVVIVGLQFTSESAARSRLFRGPSIDDASDCKDFEKLWGTDLVSTRQFADGSITRCVLIPHPAVPEASTSFDFADPGSACRTLCDAVQALTQQHVKTSSGISSAAVDNTNANNNDNNNNVEIDNIRLCAGAETLASLWITDASCGISKDPEPFTASTRSKAVEFVRDRLNQISETSLPCKVTTIEFISPSERGTEPFPPLPHVSLLSSDSLNNNNKQQEQQSDIKWISNSATLSPIQIVVQIEDRKRRVPDNPEAISTMKSVVLAQIASGFENDDIAVEAAMNSAASGTGRSGGSSGGDQIKANYMTKQQKKKVAALAASASSSVGPVQKFTVFVSKHFADVVHEDTGLMFRIVILFEREVLVLQQVGKQMEASTISRTLVWSQRHALYMKGIISQHPSIAGACRLLRRWVCAMCLGDYIPYEVSELIVVFVYLRELKLLNTSKTHDKSSSNTTSNKENDDTTRRNPFSIMSSHCGFLASLRLISQFPFEEAPLFIPRSADSGSSVMLDGDDDAAAGGGEKKNQFGGDENEGAESRAVLAWRDEMGRIRQETAGGQGPSVAQRAIFISAPYTEPDHSPFTELTPRKGILQCLQECATRAMEMFSDSLTFTSCSSSSVSTNSTNSNKEQQQNENDVGSSMFSLHTQSSFSFSVDIQDSSCQLFCLNPIFTPQNSKLASRQVPCIVSSSSSAASSSSKNNTNNNDDRVEVDQDQAKQLLQRTVEHSAVSDAVKTVRKQFRDQCMIFYDEYSPSSIHGVEFGFSINSSSSSASSQNKSIQFNRRSNNLARKVAAVQTNVFAMPEQLAPPPSVLNKIKGATAGKKQKHGKEKQQQQQQTSSKTEKKSENNQQQEQQTKKKKPFTKQHQTEQKKTTTTTTTAETKTKPKFGVTSSKKAKLEPLKKLKK